MLGSFSIPNSQVLDRFQSDFLLSLWQFFEKTIGHFRDAFGRFAVLGEFASLIHTGIVSP